jgi:hypothetical protein
MWKKRQKSEYFLMVSITEGFTIPWGMEIKPGDRVVSYRSGCHDS